MVHISAGKPLMEEKRGSCFIAVWPYFSLFLYHMTMEDGLLISPNCGLMDSIY